MLHPDALCLLLPAVHLLHLNDFYYLQYNSGDSSEQDQELQASNQNWIEGSSCPKEWDQADKSWVKRSSQISAAQVEGRRGSCRRKARITRCIFHLRFGRSC